MHDSVGLQLGTSLQSAKLQLANLLQNCYFWLIQKTISNSVLWSLVIKYFWPGCFAPPYLLRPGATAPSAPLCYATGTAFLFLFLVRENELSFTRLRHFDRQQWMCSEQRGAVVCQKSRKLVQTLILKTWIVKHIVVLFFGHAPCMLKDCSRTS